MGQDKAQVAGDVTRSKNTLPFSSIINSGPANHIEQSRNGKPRNWTCRARSGGFRANGRHGHAQAEGQADQAQVLRQDPERRQEAALDCNSDFLLAVSTAVVLMAPVSNPRSKRRTTGRCSCRNSSSRMGQSPSKDSKKKSSWASIHLCTRSSTR